ncbi:Glyoxylase, beta-lactamase superfamily II [Catalinimonas alkaloidigena]|uniref:Glyoxylase, beta-lactamase superfamily II n=1 Tax=Catalinimonas alkaloidigena TaxID=1075417 RepID=A0A1G9P071_9BACT|nr:MBL fold metallo-hydrolase [Catalinimonas alkaloidigena]SDL92272.1 Glyoxylase, beta-lactamase superfamily II [Catalinimonas alkaloidigena]
MKIEQIYDKALAHGSYAIVSEGQVALVDPGRDPQPYLDFAEKHHGTIVAVFETHPHADFASSHLEFQQRFGATVYINPKVGVSYPFLPLQHGDEVRIGKVTFRALFTPGHSPDHNAYLLLDEAGKPHAVFTGDSLFVGDVGRPDLREGAGHVKANRKELAGMMYDTVNTVFAPLPDDVLVYPAHGAGSLCGKNMSTELYSTIGQQKEENWAFHVKEKQAFVESFLDGQPFIPKYFPYDVELNRKGADPLAESIERVPRLASAEALEKGVLIVDTRNQEAFKAGHLNGALNIQNKEGDKFETWLGALVSPTESFYLVAEDEEALAAAIVRAAKIGYEKLIKGALVNPAQAPVKSDRLDLNEFKAHPERYTIVDIRNQSEVATGKIFDSAVEIPLPELRDRSGELATDKPIVVHCAGGYRSAAGASILERKLAGATVYDLSEAVKEFK